MVISGRKLALVVIELSGHGKPSDFRENRCQANDRHSTLTLNNQPLV
jgi:hypothetical protein